MRHAPALLRRLAWLFSSAVICLGGCGESTRSDVSVHDSAGVAIVTSLGADRPAPFALEEVRQIGGADTGAASFSSASRFSVSADARGLIYVLDAQAYRVAVFDTSGAVVRTMGRQGGGPGELQFPGMLWLSADGTVEVMDYAKGALVRFDPGGTLLPQIFLKDIGYSEGRPHRMGPDTVVMITNQVTEKTGTLRLMVKWTADSLELRSQSVPNPGMVMFSCVGLNIPRIFSPQLRLAGFGDRFAVTGQIPYQVDLYRGTALERSVRREVEPQPADESALARLYPEGMTIGFSGGGKCVIPVAELREKLGVADRVPLISALALAPDGVLWVERYTFKDEPPRVDVFDPEGAYLGTVTGHGAPLGFAGQLVLFPVEDEATGITRVGLFRITSGR
jgi:hypothetical protein